MGLFHEVGGDGDAGGGGMTNNKKAIKILRKRQRFCKVIAEYANETVKADELREVEALDMAIPPSAPSARSGWRRCGGVSGIDTTKAEYMPGMELYALSVTCGITGPLTSALPAAL